MYFSFKSQNLMYYVRYVRKISDDWDLVLDPSATLDLYTQAFGLTIPFLLLPLKDRLAR